MLEGGRGQGLARAPGGGGLGGSPLPECTQGVPKEKAKLFHSDPIRIRNSDVFGVDTGVVRTRWALLGVPRVHDSALMKDTRNTYDAKGHRCLAEALPRSDCIEMAPLLMSQTWPRVHSKQCLVCLMSLCTFEHIFSSKILSGAAARPESSNTDSTSAETLYVEQKWHLVDTNHKAALLRNVPKPCFSADLECSAGGGSRVEGFPFPPAAREIEANLWEGVKV